MKTMRRILSLLIAIVMTMGAVVPAFAASETSYTVTFNLNEHGTGDAPAAQTVKANEKATEPEKPTDPDYTFLGWYKEAAGTTAYDFNTPVTGDMTLYAKWSSDKTRTVTLHKILMTQENLDAKNEEGKDVFPGTTGLNGEEYVGNKIEQIGDSQDNTIKGFFGKDAKEIDGVFFAWQRQFKVPDLDDEGVQKEDQDGNKLFKNEWHFIDDHGNDLGTDIDNPTGGGTVLGDKTGKTGFEFQTNNLPNDTYRIIEIKEKSTYIGNEGALLTDSKAVPVVITLPLVNDNGVVENAHVYPKNTEEKPGIDKNFKFGQGESHLADDGKTEGDFNKVDITKGEIGVGQDKNEVVSPEAGAQLENYDKKKATVTESIGKKLPYEVKTKIPAHSKYKKLKWTDTMSDGLTYNKDLKIVTDDTTITFDKDTDYKLIQDDHGFTLYFTLDGLKKIEDKDKDIIITITYSAIVNADAVIDEPEKNDIKLDYGNKPGKENEPTTTTPDNGELTVEKDWAVDGNEVTEADKNVTAVFTLQEQQEDGTWKDVESYTVTVAENFTHTFTGLDNNKTYRVVERVSGYEPEYTSTDEAGKIIISNYKDSTNPTPLNPTEPQVVVGGKKFVKADKDTGARLAGAEFKVKNAEGKFLKAADPNKIQEAMEAYKVADKAYNDAIAAWNEAVTNNPGVADDQIKVTIGGEEITGKTAVMAKIKELREDRDTKFATASNPYEWGTEGEATVFKSNENGQVEVTGLAYGSYTLVETKAPEGYAVPSNNTTDFKVEKGSYTSNPGGVKYEGTDPVTDGAENADAIRINNMKVTIPQTGGIGSVIFVIAGLLLMGLAAYKIKSNRQEELR